MSEEWWYVEENNKVGPMDRAEILALVKKEQINLHTLVWTKGMSEWLWLMDIDSIRDEAIEIVREIKASTPPPIPVRKKAQEQVMESPAHTRQETSSQLTKTKHTPITNTEARSYIPAGLWKRFFARVFDITWEIILVSICTGFIIGFSYAVLGLDSDYFFRGLSHPGWSVIFGVVNLFFSFILDAVIYAWFRNTPGKYLLGLRVQNSDMSLLSFKQYTRRNLNVYFHGVGLGIPLVNFILMAYQAGRLSRGKRASYDEQNKWGVYGKLIGIPRVLLFALASILLLALTAGVSSNA